jgi:2-keto-4-pentenoate hydratase/2-oxohepta-3-ene-1,7-dioic acid hydratase in catechol pathway
MKVAKVLDKRGESFAIVSPDGKMAIPRDEIQRQTGLTLHASLEDFIFHEDSQKLAGHLPKLTFRQRIGDFRLLPPITRSFKIMCLAFNYSDQTSWVRFGKSPPKDPVIYMKSRTSLTGPFDDIVCPNFVTQLDYEGELAFVIKKRCKGISEKEATGYVGGYFVLNDVSARDIQFTDKQYTRAKSFDTFGPCGPWLTTPDEIRDPCDLRLVTKVNGEVRQDSSTKNLVLRIDRIIHSLSKAMTLEPGDIVSTGTPAGTVLSLSSQLKYLQSGDVVEVEIEGLGKIKNRVVREA